MPNSETNHLVAEKKEGYARSTILVVEDEEISYLLVREVLSAYPSIIVVRAHNGVEAQKFLSKHHKQVSLVLMDIKMPLLNGYETTRWIKDNFSLPVVAVTAFVHQNSIEKCKECGCDDMLMKPFDLNHFLKIVKRYCRQIS
mgnify:CR=1 FL=1